LNGGLIIPDKKTAKALNDLARHTAILRILKDVQIDLEICEIEGWDKTEYIKQLKKLLDSIGQVNRMDDLISRQAAIDALDVLCQEHRYKIPGKRETYSQYNEAWQDALDRAEGAIFNLPSAQPEEAISVAWINKHLEWLDNCDNDFAQLAKTSIRAMVEIWKKDKT